MSYLGDIASTKFLKADRFGTPSCAAHDEQLLSDLETLEKLLGNGVFAQYYTSKFKIAKISNLTSIECNKTRMVVSLGINAL